MFNTESLETPSKEQKELSRQAQKMYYSVIDYLCNNLPERTALMFLRNLVRHFTINSHAVITPKFVHESFKTFFDLESLKLNTPHKQATEFIQKSYDTVCALMGEDFETIKRNIGIE